jgi:hypothetical protein
MLVFNRHGPFYTIQTTEFSQLFFETRAVTRSRIYYENNVTKQCYLDVVVKDEMLSLLHTINAECKAMALKNIPLPYTTFVTDEGVVRLKIPYRYSKIEIPLLGTTDNRITSFDIVENEDVCVKMKCDKLWFTEHSCGCTWVCQSLKLN